jgi:hypothetical protein
MKIIRDTASKKFVTTRDADKFISEVLKLGTKQNLFDQFMEQEGIHSSELSTLVDLVADRIKEKWT